MDDAGAADSPIIWGRLIAIIFGFVLIIGPIAGGEIYTIHRVNYEHSKIVSVYVQDLYIASLAPSSLNRNRTTTTAFNGSVSVELKLERKKALTRLHFNKFQMTLFYGQSDVIAVGSSMVEGFSMGRKMKSVHVIGEVEALAMPWQEALQAITAGNVVNMAVELRWPSKNYYFRYTADVLVDHSGHMNEPIEFRQSPFVFNEF